MLFSQVMLKIFAILLLSPLLQGFIKRIKAILQGRHGPDVFQPYRDLWKYAAKKSVVSREVTWVFGYTPVISFSAILIASIMVPWVLRSGWGFLADFVLFVYLLAIPRFMIALAGLDASGAFGGMASSREMAVSALVEPALFLALLTLSLPTGSLRLDSFVGLEKTTPLFSPQGFLAGCAFLLVVIAEVGRIPVDNPDTHLELTMIHEGMILEYSGPALGLLHLTHWMKQLTLVALMANAFFPQGMVINVSSGLILAAGGFCFKILCGAFVLAAVESALAKLRLFQMMDLLGFSFILSAIALLFGAT